MPQSGETQMQQEPLLLFVVLNLEESTPVFAPAAIQTKDFQGSKFGIKQVLLKREGSAPICGFLPAVGQAGSLQH